MILFGWQILLYIYAPNYSEIYHIVHLAMHLVVHPRSPLVPMLRTCPRYRNTGTNHITGGTWDPEFGRPPTIVPALWGPLSWVLLGRGPQRDDRVLLLPRACYSQPHLSRMARAVNLRPTPDLHQQLSVYAVCSVYVYVLISRDSACADSIAQSLYSLNTNSIVLVCISPSPRLATCAAANVQYGPTVGVGPPQPSAHKIRNPTKHIR
jgi:hypothetical protein